MVVREDWTLFRSREAVDQKAEVELIPKIVVQLWGCGRK